MTNKEADMARPGVVTLMKRWINFLTTTKRWKVFQSAASWIGGEGYTFTLDGTNEMLKDKRQRRDLHALNEDGMVLCNPRDREAAHRAEMEAIATYDHAPVTCRKCLLLIHKIEDNA